MRKATGLHLTCAHRPSMAMETGTNEGGPKYAPPKEPEQQNGLWWSGTTFCGGSGVGGQPLRVDFDDGDLVVVRKPAGASATEAIDSLNAELLLSAPPASAPASASASASASGIEGKDERIDRGSTPSLPSAPLVPVVTFLRQCSPRTIRGWSVAARSASGAADLESRIHEVSGAFVAVVDSIPRRRIVADGEVDVDRGDRRKGGGRSDEDDGLAVRVLSSRRTRNTRSGYLHLIEVECRNLARDGSEIKSTLRKRFGCAVVGGRARNVLHIKGGGKGTCLAMIRLSIPRSIGKILINQDIPSKFCLLLERQERAYMNWRAGQNGRLSSNIEDSEEKLNPSSESTTQESRITPFLGRPFLVPTGLFSPRSGSSILVHAALAELPRERPVRVLDLGTGTGCLLLSVLLGIPDSNKAMGVGIDLCTTAIAAAQVNASRWGIDRSSFVRADFLASDMPAVALDALSRLTSVYGSPGEGPPSCDSLPTAPFDIVLCNPPYLDPKRLPPSFEKGDPPLAIFAGEHGLDVYRALSDRDGVLANWRFRGLVGSGSLLVLEVPAGGSCIADRVERMFVSGGSGIDGHTIMKSLGFRRDEKNAPRCLVLKWI